MINLYNESEKILGRVQDLMGMNLDELKEEYKDFKSENNSEPFESYKYIRAGISTETSLLIQNLELIKLKESLLKYKESENG